MVDEYEFYRADGESVNVGTAGLRTDGYIYAKNQVAQFHSNETQTASLADTWYNISYNLVSLSDTTIGNWYERDASNKVFTANFNGIIRFQGCMIPYNSNNTSSKQATVFGRVLLNDVEQRCSQVVMSKSFSSKGRATMDIIGTINVSEGDEIKIQWRTTDTDITLSASISEFDNPTSASMNFERISNQP